MITPKTLVVAGCLALGVACLVHAADAPGAIIRLTVADIASLPAIAPGPGTSGVAGIRTRVLAGDPTKAGAYTIALSVPANTRIAAHRHRDSRSAVVVAGEWFFGYGDKADDSVKALGAGGFYTEPADVAHFARTGAQPATVYISGFGPTDTHYVVAPAAGH